MKLFIAVCLCFSILCAKAQKLDTTRLDTKPDFTDLRTFLKIPSGYNIVQLEFVYANKHEILKEQIAGNTLNVHAKNIMAIAQPGASVYFNDIVIEKDGKQQKWMSRFLVLK